MLIRWIADKVQDILICHSFLFLVELYTICITLKLLVYAQQCNSLGCQFSKTKANLLLKLSFET